jgi:hypothetical protein
LAIAAIMMGAAVVLALPGFSPEVEASSPAPIAKSDRLEVRPIGKDCSEQAWPYYETKCLIDRTQASGQARTVRQVSPDRLTAKQ